MKKIFIFTLIIFITTLFIRTNPQKEGFEAASKKAFAKFNAEQDRKIGVLFLEELLLSYPNYKYIHSYLKMVTDIYIKELNQPENAVLLAKKVLKQSTNSHSILMIHSVLIDILSSTGKIEEFIKTVEILEKMETLNQSLETAIYQAAVKHNRWTLVEKHADAAVSFSTFDAIKSNVLKSGSSMPDNVIHLISLRETGQAMAAKGWALIKLDRFNDGIEIFKKAEKNTLYNFVDVPQSKLNLYWSQALLEAGQPEKAIELISPDAVMLGSEEAKSVLKKALISYTGTEEGFDEFMWDQRKKNAKKVKNFTLFNYKNEKQQFDKLKGNVTLLVFWTPHCAFCQFAMPVFEQLWQKYKKKGFSVIAVEVDRVKGDAQKFIAEKNLTYHFLETEKNKRDIAHKIFKVDGTPSFFLIDPNSKVFFFYEGFTDGMEQNIEKDILKLFKNKS